MLVKHAFLAILAYANRVFFFVSYNDLSASSNGSTALLLDVFLANVNGE